ncbi:MAG: aerotolerance regulator BatA [Armatimonadetes bacterium CG17_big_fil_post_rev_8_21_14_2_50_66_6]|nr:VWA domain-containing protein [Armatimonadota bacterium]PIU95626.1 MAG: aerotolerance regulator BatA [Armatimonadetes bacterium CG06_land_8_20_14_3_00_66_21]PIW13630.1 MAG: aerotolerance regulator BatA [Armatimonadetes bacterium CG17_big_fil_post_rev_8_21_14_2_50_66_6]PIX44285.1 MAG: aerotolerance regulator BatA [Armatimonadetes bacterium CG_4_8_14_3_um_filter_66_20]PJB61384.1 MAG: aerotolerance regulator BatA [Armatimonadetes bacterium CG_4_9_14_3_um_filter_66_14]
MIRFASPWGGLALLAFAGAVWVLRRRRPLRSGSLRYSDLAPVRQRARGAGGLRAAALGGLRALVIVLTCLAVARPQTEKSFEEITTEGIDIMLGLDLSGSMKALDFKPDTRAEAAKKVVAEFVKGLSNDRVGLVVFGTRSFLQCPLTLDYGVLLSFLDRCEVGLAGDGTALGLALGNCANRLKQSKAKSKVVILLTDGTQTAGNIDPITAARAAHAVGCRIYTIGMGQTDTPLVAVEDPFFGTRLVPQRFPLDEDTLRKVAAAADGKYYRATDSRKLESIYKEIWKLEKSKIKVKDYQRFQERFTWFLLPAVLLLLLEIGLTHTLFRKLP